MTGTTSGALLGLGVGVGIALVMSWLAVRRPPDIATRIRPSLTGGSIDYASHGSVDRVLAAIRTRIGVRQRLATAGIKESPAHYRLEQVAWAALGGAIGGSVAVLLGVRAPGVVVLPAVGAVMGVAARDWCLGRRVRRRREQIEAEVPAVAELLAFAVAAGEGPYAALVRVTQCMGGELAREVGIATADMRSGMPLESALRSMSDRVGSRGVSRLVDGLLLAVDRGTPLADVLRAQAADAQAEGRRRLMELAGRKDVAMLVPVVFLILPTVVVVALFPGLQSLRLIAP